MFSDESGFKIIGSSIMQNKRKWRKENLENFTEENENKCIKINLWVSISKKLLFN